MTNHTVESLTADEKQTWRMIRKELEGIGITIAAFDANKAFILQWFQAAMQAGAFEEQSTDQDAGGSEQDTLPAISVSSKTSPLSLSSPNNPSNGAIIEPGNAADEMMRHSSEQQAPAKNTTANTRLKRGTRLTSLLFKVLSRKDLPRYMLQAARDGDLGAVRSALRQGVNVNLQDDDGCTPLYIAVAHGHETMVKLLLENHADTDQSNHNGNAPLNIAAERGSLGIAELLVKAGVDLMAPSKFGDTSLHIAALHGRTSIAELLLLQGSDIEAVADDGLTPLSQAVTRGHKSMIVLLLDKGAKIHATTNDGDSVLHLAALTRDLACFELLASNGAVIDKKNKQGQTPLYTVIADKANSHLSNIDESKTIAIAELLLDKGADIMTTVPWNPITLLHWASSYRQVHLVEFLLGKGAQVDANPQGRTVLYEQVATWADRPIIEALLKGGANVNARATDGTTVLHLTASRWYADLGRLFINAGANCDARTNRGETVLNIAMKRIWPDGHHQAQFLDLLKSGVPELHYDVDQPRYNRI